MELPEPLWLPLPEDDESAGDRIRWSPSSSSRSPSGAGERVEARESGEEIETGEAER